MRVKIIGNCNSHGLTIGKEFEVDKILDSGLYMIKGYYIQPGDTSPVVGSQIIINVPKGKVIASQVTQGDNVVITFEDARKTAKHYAKEVNIIQTVEIISENIFRVLLPAANTDLLLANIKELQKFHSTHPGAMLWHTETGIDVHCENIKQ